MSFLISADEEEQIRQSEEYKQYMEEHKEENDMAKSTKTYEERIRALEKK